MISLREFGEIISPMLGLSAAAVYERQRALVRLGIFPQPIKGRGHGLVASPSTVAPLLLSVMATESLSEIDERIVRLCNARPSKSATCEITGAKTFRQAVARLLEDPSLSQKGALLGLSVWSFSGGLISYVENDSKGLFTSFQVPSSKSPTQFIQREVRAKPELIRAIVDDLRAAGAEQTKE
jgi:hypothetical protein